MTTMQIVCLILVLFSTGDVCGQKTAEDYLNKCVQTSAEGINKEKASPEPGLECTSFRDMSCCYANSTTNFFENHKYYDYINFVPCPEKPRLSPECEKAMHDEMCFYLCSTNVGPYLIEALLQGFEHLDRLPICASQCDKWWNACKNEYTCHRNWVTDMDWSSGINKCKEGSVCKRYEEMYQSADEFCNILWHGAYNVVPDDEPCMIFNPDPSKPNPNDEVAQTAAELRVAQESQ